MAAPNLEQDYIDLFALLVRVGNTGSYCDFEGFAGPSYVRKVLEDRRVTDVLKWYPEIPELRDLLAHYIYENLDSAGYKVTPTKAAHFVESVGYVLQGARYWCKVDA
jgi:hypothetical protein